MKYYSEDLVLLCDKIAQILSPKSIDAVNSVSLQSHIMHAVLHVCV